VMRANIVNREAMHSLAESDQAALEFEGAAARESATLP